MEGKKGRARRCWQLLHTFVRIGAFTFGGGYAMIPLIQREAVEKRGWIEDGTCWIYWRWRNPTPGPIARQRRHLCGIPGGRLLGIVVRDAGGGIALLRDHRPAFPGAASV